MVFCVWTWVSLCLYVLPVLLKFFFLLFVLICLSIDFLFLFSFIVLLFLDYCFFSNEREREHECGFRFGYEGRCGGSRQSWGRGNCNQNTCMIKTSFLSKKQKRVSQNVNFINPPSNNVIKCIISQQLERMSFCLYSPWNVLLSNVMLIEGPRKTHILLSNFY